MKIPAAFIAWLCLVCAAAAYAADTAPVAGEKDKCPVCGMFVAPYPAWTGVIVLKDRHCALFSTAPKTSSPIAIMWPHTAPAAAAQTSLPFG